MEQGAKNYAVTADGSQSDLQRDALLSAADKRGMEVVLPSAAALAKSNIAGEALGSPPFPVWSPPQACVSKDSRGEPLHLAAQARPSWTSRSTAIQVARATASNVPFSP